MSRNFREMHQRTAKARLQFLVVLLFVHDAVVLANPKSGAVVAGSATISRSGSNVTVTQTTNRAVINWQGFSIAKGEKTTFNLPGSHAAVLNRVVGADPSAIHGMLNSNGRVYLINPNGVVIGPTGRVNTAGFVASTMNVPNSEFMQGGNLNFTGSSTATVENYGTITASNGDVYLIAGRVINNGTIQSPNGTIGLVAGQDVSVVDSANPKIAVRPTAQSFGGTGVYNGGILEAMQVELSANGSNIYGLAINNAGMIRATGSATVGGRVYLVSNGGNILSTGTLIAKKGENGGDIIAHAGGGPGSSVTLKGPVDVSGVQTGGTVFVKGAVIAVADANVNLSAPTPGQMVLSVGPHSVTPGNSSAGTPLNWNLSPDGMTLTNDGAPLVKVSSSTQILQGDSNTVTTGGSPFVDLVIESGDPNKPFLQFVGFQLEGSGSVPDSAAILVKMEVREPDGSIVTNHLVLDADAFANGKVTLTATAGELIHKITINSNQGGYNFDPSTPTIAPTAIGETPTPFINSVTQIGADAAVTQPTILIVKKLTTSEIENDLMTVFQFRLNELRQETPTLLNEFGLKDQEQFATLLTPGTYSVAEILPDNGWFVDVSFNDGNPTPIRIDHNNPSIRTVTVEMCACDTHTVTFHNIRGSQIIVKKEALGPGGSTTNFNFAADSLTSGALTPTSFALTGGSEQRIGSTELPGFLRPGSYTVTEGTTPGWNLTGVRGLNGIDGLDGSSATINLAAGTTRVLTFQNAQTVAPLFRWDPIYPDGVGAGALAYGTFIRPTPAGSATGVPGIAAAGSTGPGVVLDTRGEEEFFVADEDEDSRERRVAGPKRIRLGGGGESSFETFRTGTATP